MLRVSFHGAGSSNLKSSCQSERGSAMISVRVVCEGVTPLLMNMFKESWILYYRLKPSTSQEIAASKIYKDDASRIGIPMGHLFVCLKEAGRHVKNGRRRITTNGYTMLPSILSIKENFLLLTDGNGGPPMNADSNADERA